MREQSKTNVSATKPCLATRRQGFRGNCSEPTISVLADHSEGAVVLLESS